jgi:hypothetical protein
MLLKKGDPISPREDNILGKNSKSHRKQDSPVPARNVPYSLLPGGQVLMDTTASGVREDAADTVDAGRKSLIFPA